ncbi:MAG TPA: hypothetical protein VGF24_36680 [Vicinamibacterales bacterium]|jgi:hypothetical protein
MAPRVTPDSPPRITRPTFNVLVAGCIVVATLPIIAARFALVPIYESQRLMLPAYGTFFCLLGFAYVFSLRHELGREMFFTSTVSATTVARRHRISINVLLACLILASIGAAAIYLWTFESGRTSPTFPKLPSSSAGAVMLTLSYVTMFVLAEGAFAIMAVREYLQDVMGLTDAEAVAGTPTSDETSPSTHVAISYRVVPRDSISSAESQFESERSTADERRHDASLEVGDRTTSADTVSKVENTPAAALRG